MAKGDFVSYLRVSTQRQGQSGLGLEAQRQAVAEHIKSAGGKLRAEFVEVESGKKNGRPELDKALAECRKVKATLVIAKLDRLARNARFLLSIVEGVGEGGVVFCDLPQIPDGAVGKFLITQMAAVAELEAGLISQRTKAALAAAKRRGKRLGFARSGGKSLQRQASRKGRAAMVATADSHAANIRPVILSIQKSGAKSYRAIADALNARGIPTARGGKWYATTVKNILTR